MKYPPPMFPVFETLKMLKDVVRSVTVLPSGHVILPVGGKLATPVATLVETYGALLIDNVGPTIARATVKIVTAIMGVFLIRFIEFIG